jgi:hypothetical protein
MTTDNVYNLIILDESGSMSTIKSYTISGFNEIVQTIKGIERQYPGQKHYISLVSFNGMGIRTLLDKQPVSGLNKIDERTYHPNSSTPLYDAIGLSVLKLRIDLAGIDNKNVLVTIFTDGEENSSREFNGAQIKKIIEEQKALGWTFTFIGANQDVMEEAQKISITNTMHFMADAADMKRMFSKEARSRQFFSKKIHEKSDLHGSFYDDQQDPKEEKDNR